MSTTDPTEDPTVPESGDTGDSETPAPEPTTPDPEPGPTGPDGE